ncbi:calcium-translocating P-type ATPase, SERCA-type [Methanosarcina mazei]|uniref:ATPase n=3 Tax=Methanosarcina mazei TaxID=2209 RepID=A0A0F8RVM8_METMZ|nr:calcium-translocating P-type ATPase, SERCA-type [Methanosarcina mazei]AKB39482.1 Cation-transporting ATPase, E1-E2 family [Methanosarcina mazei WWM610]AKB70379.1 Cation-transporting ATPase, E1-E2 family [Methanosarcina mazei C16]KKG01474.1 ATPase [Methanosarcina mazei]KKG05162.1 ATPase [Methanosarcina mazei]KKG18776.1 ATPase [Methanosarcina mazei]
MYYDQDISSVFGELRTSVKGLSPEDAEKRLEEYGKNELKEKEKVSVFRLFLSQFKSILILILVIAAIVSALLGEAIDAAVILFTVFLAGILGFVQEYRAEKAIELLKSLTSPEATVIRNGSEKKIPSTYLVPGDIILLQTGDRIPADARIIEEFNLKVDESSLTGESVPVQKVIDALPAGTSEADRNNMVYAGTAVAYGRGKAVITATGMKTSFGELAGLLGTIERSRTPLQESLDKFGRWIGGATIVIVAFVAVLGVFLGFPPLDMFLWGVALAVAAIPEALPAVVTVGLGLGVRRMVKRHALVRKLPSVETLGATNVICSDKTGTLTQNKMTVERIYVDRQILRVTGGGYDPDGKFLKGDSEKEDPEVSGDDMHLRVLLLSAALCNDSNLYKEEDGWKIRGDPTEAALVVAAAKAGFEKSELDSKYPRLAEIPFSSESKRMTTFNKLDDFPGDVLDSELVAFSKGAPEVILGSCTKIFLDGEIKTLTHGQKQEILEEVKELADQALRVMAFSFRPFEEGFSPEKISSGKIPVERAEEDMVFSGLTGMRDPPREEVKAAIRTCEDAGIKTVMITGDHKVTAAAIARELGILKENDLTLTGSELDSLEEKEFEDRVERVSVYARVYPAHKLRVVEALKKKGYVVAMTGDGVNDAPALKAADMGIAMGITGTDVSKEASSMILTDDNFASIVSAVEEGRNIFKNIRNFITYGLTCHIGEVLIVLIAILGWQILPLMAVQILWINLITDGLPPMALSVEPPDRGLMRQKPRNVEEGLITRREITAGLGIGTLVTLQALIVLVWSLESGFSLSKLQTMVFTLVVFSEMFNAFNWRSDRYSVFSLGLFTNKALIYAVLTTVVLQLMVIYVPFLQLAFSTVPLSLPEWGIILALASTTLISMEIVKHINNGKRAD